MKAKTLLLTLFVLGFISSGMATITYDSPVGDVADPVGGADWRVDQSSGPACYMDLYVDYGGGTTKVDRIVHDGGSFSAAYSSTALDETQQSYGGGPYSWEIVGNTSECDAGGDPGTPGPAESWSIPTMANQVDIYAQNAQDGATFVGDPASLTFDGQLDATLDDVPPGDVDFMLDGSSVDTTPVSGGSAYDLGFSGDFSAGTYDWFWRYTGDDSTTDSSQTYTFEVVTEASTVTYSGFNPGDNTDITDRTPDIEFTVDSDYSGSGSLYVEGVQEATYSHPGDGAYTPPTYTLSEQDFGSHSYYITFTSDGDGSSSQSKQINYEIVKDASVSITSPNDGDNFNTGEQITVDYDYNTNMDGTVSLTPEGQSSITHNVQAGDSGSFSDTITFDDSGPKDITVDFSADSYSYTDSSSISVDITSDASTFDITYQNPDDGDVLYEDTSSFEFDVSSTESGSLELFVDGSRVTTFNHGGGSDSYSYSYGPYTLGSHQWYVQYIGDDGSTDQGATQSFEYRTTDFIQNATVDYNSIGGTLSKRIRLDLRGDAAISSRNSISGANTVTFNSDEWVLDGFSDSFSDTFVVGDGQGHDDSWSMDFDVSIGSLESDPGTWNFSTQRLNRDIDVQNNANQSLYNLTCANNGYQNDVAGTVDVSIFTGASSSFTHTCKWQGDYISETVDLFTILDDRIVLSENYTAYNETTLTEDAGVDWNNNLNVSESVVKPVKCTQENNTLTSLSAGATKTIYPEFDCDPGTTGTLNTGSREEGTATIVSLNVSNVEIFTDVTSSKPIVRRIDKDSAPFWASRIRDTVEAFTDDISFGAQYQEITGFIEHITNTSYSTSSLSAGTYDLKINYTANKPPKYKNVSDNATSKVLEGNFVNASGWWRDDETTVDYVYMSTNETGSWRNYSTMLVDNFEDGDTSGWTGNTSYFSTTSGIYGRHAGKLEGASGIPAVNKSVTLKHNDNLQFRIGSPNSGDDRAGLKLYNESDEIIGSIYLYQGPQLVAGTCYDSVVWRYANVSDIPTTDYTTLADLSISCDTEDTLSVVDVSFDKEADEATITINGTTTTVHTRDFTNVTTQSLFSTSGTNATYDQHRRTVDVNPATGNYERADTLWQNKSVGNKYVCWKQTGIDTTGGQNITGENCFDTYRLFEQRENNTINLLDTGIGFKFFDTGFTEDISISSQIEDTVNFLRNTTQEISIGSTISRQFNASVEKVQSIVIDAVTDEDEKFKGNFQDDISITQVASSSALPRARTIKVWDEDYDRLFRAEGGEQIHVRFNGTHTDGRNELEYANVSLRRPDGSLTVNAESMTVLNEISKGYRYEYNFTTPETIQTAGTWKVVVDLEDQEGNVNTNTTTYVLQTPDTTVTTPVQESVNIYEDVPFSKDITVRNPSNTDFLDTIVNISIPTDTIQESMSLTDEIGNNIAFDENLNLGFFTFTIPTLNDDEVREYTNEYEVKGLDIQRDNFTVEQGNKRVQRVQFNMSTVGPTDFEDLTHKFDIRNPEQVTSTSLLVNGTDRTVDEGYDFQLVDTDNDDLGDEVQFTVPEIDDRLDYEVRIVRGQPLDIESETVILNPPATTTKLIEWRKGLRFSNPNNFAIEINRKVRVPLRASNIIYDGAVIDKRFDDEGSYVPLTLNLESNSNETAFYTYNTPAIDITTSRNTPDVYWLDKDVTEYVNVTFENPYPDPISTAEFDLNILEGSNLVVEVGDKVVDERDIVEGNYVVGVENISGNSQKVAEISYNVPVANVSYEGVQNVSSGNTLEVFSVASTSPVSRPNAWFEIDGEMASDEFNCIQADRVFNLANNNSVDFRCGSEVDGAENELSTVVELDTLGPNENIRLGVEHRPYRPVIDDIRRVYVVLGNNAFVTGLVILIVLLSVAGYRRLTDEQKINNLLSRFN